MTPPSGGASPPTATSTNQWWAALLPPPLDPPTIPAAAAAPLNLEASTDSAKSDGKDLGASTGSTKIGRQSLDFLAPTLSLQ